MKKIINFFKDTGHYRNFYYIKYHLLKGIYKNLVKLNLIKPNDLKNKDTFNWSYYNLHYRGELKDSAKEFNNYLKPDDYSFSNGELLKINKDILPLHPNHQLLYETILQLNPASIFELGCGNGMHLYNLGILKPDLKLSGVDLLAEQIKFLRQTFPDLKAEIKQIDATNLFTENFIPKSDLSFSQTVIMHIHTGEAHKIAMANMFNMANKYVVLMEKWKNHNYLDDIREIFEKKQISWEKIYFYYRETNTEPKTFIMICSNSPLNYPELTNYNVFPQS